MEEIKTETTTKQKKPKKPIYKKWWFWVIIVVVLFAMVPTSSDKDKDNDKDTAEKKDTITYELVGGELGEYGKVITLNKDTDMPVDKYLYKLPEGNYKVTTTNKKVSSFYVAKDEITINEDSDYPEELQPVGEQYLLSAGDDMEKIAIKEIDITLNADESIVLPTTSDYITVTKIE